MKNSTPGRLACVDLPAFPLQLLLRRHPDWVAQPVAVVAEDKPQGLVLWVNEKARQLGVLPGLRYAAALSLAGGLRAGAVAPKEMPLVAPTHAHGRCHAAGKQRTPGRCACKPSPRDP